MQFASENQTHNLPDMDCWSNIFHSGFTLGMISLIAIFKATSGQLVPFSDLHGFVGI